MVGDVVIGGVHDHDGVAERHGGLFDEELQTPVGEVRGQKPAHDRRELLVLQEA